MFKSLRRKLPLLFVAVSIVSVLIVSIVTNVTILSEFNSYMLSSQDNRNTGIIDSLSMIYKANNGWNSAAIDEIRNSPVFSNINLVIRDRDKVQVLDINSIPPMMARGMGGMMRSMMGTNTDYTEKSFSIIVDGSLVGYADIGYFGSLSLSLPDISFIGSINRSTMTAAAASVLAALILSLVISKRISNPIVELTKVANRIKLGDLKARWNGNANNLEIEELSSAMNSLAASLDRQESIRRRMTSDIAHELRTPLATLKSYLEAILDGVFEPSPERLSSCYEEVIRLSKLVKNLEQLNRLENDTLKIEKSLFNLEELVSNLVDTFKPQYLEKNVSLLPVTGNKIEIIADKDKISQVIVNLLSNAHKYSNPGGRVEVSAYMDGDHAIIKVSDNGTGIPEQDLPYIFDRLYRGDKSRSRETGGAGIGLAIVKAVVDAHGGSIEVKSKLDTGSEFIIKLPMKSK